MNRLENKRGGELNLKLSEKIMGAKHDESLEEIWEIRRQIAKEFGYDPKKQVAHYQQKQKQMGARIYRREKELADANG